jgi:hypothetical protein
MLNQAAGVNCELKKWKTKAKILGNEGRIWLEKAREKEV